MQTLKKFKNFINEELINEELIYDGDNTQEEIKKEYDSLEPITNTKYGHFLLEISELFNVKLDVDSCRYKAYDDIRVHIDSSVIKIINAGQFIFNYDEDYQSGIFDVFEDGDASDLEINDNIFSKMSKLIQILLKYEDIFDEIEFETYGYNNYNGGDDDNYDEEEEEDEYSDEELTSIDEIKDFHKYILKKDFNL